MSEQRNHCEPQVRERQIYVIGGRIGRRLIASRAIPMSWRNTIGERHLGRGACAHASRAAPWLGRAWRAHYVSGGRAETQSMMTFRASKRSDPAANRWTRAASMPCGHGLAGAVVGNRLHM